MAIAAPSSPQISVTTSSVKRPTTRGVPRFAWRRRMTAPATAAMDRSVSRNARKRMGFAQPVRSPGASGGSGASSG